MATSAILGVVPFGLVGAQVGTARVLVVFSRLGTGAGAEATLTDVCEAVINGGALCVVIVGKSRRSERTRLRRRLRDASLARVGRARVISASRLLDFRVAPSLHISDVGARKFGILSARHLFDVRRVLARVLLRKANHVLVGQVLTAKGVSELVTLAPRAVITLNHNGEPGDFLAQWKFLESPGKSTAVQNYSEYLQSFHRILFQNVGQRKAFDDLGYLGVGRTAVIWPSCDETAALRAVAEPDPYDSSFVNLVCVAKFQRSKKQLELIQAFGSVLPRNPGIRLTFLGDSIRDRSYLEECQEYVIKHDLDDHVRFLGYRTDALRFIAHCDMFVLVSEGEGTSRAVREAAFLGKPIVSRKLEGVESFLGTEGAFWVKKNDVGAALEEGLSDAHRRATVARSGKDRYTALATQAKFSVAVQAYFGLSKSDAMNP